jgi:hypothetical protein
MSIRHKALIFCGFFGFLSLLILPQFITHVQLMAQERAIPPAESASSSPPPPSQAVPWYRDPARMALAGTLAGAAVGAIATTLAAFMTGFINLRVRKITNEHEREMRQLISQHELQKLSVQKQLEVYGGFFEKIVEFDSVAPKDLPDGLFKGLISVISAFEQSYPFLDKETIKVFDEQISIPFKNQEFEKMLYEKGDSTLYREVRNRLMRKVMPTAKAFLDSFK